MTMSTFPNFPHLFKSALMIWRKWEMLPQKGRAKEETGLDATGGYATKGRFL
jgi:hypothetical protein